MQQYTKSCASLGSFLSGVSSCDAQPPLVVLEAKRTSRRLFDSMKCDVHLRAAIAEQEPAPAAREALAQGATARLLEG